MMPPVTHTLDDVGAVLDLLAHGVAEAVGAGRDAIDEARLASETQVGEAGLVVAVPAAHPQGVQRHEQARSHDIARGDGVAQRRVDPVRGTHLAHRGDAGEQRAPGVGGGPQCLRWDRATQVVDGVAVPVVAHLDAQVRVGVDDARQQRGVAQLDDPRAGRHRQGAAYGLDASTCDEHDGVAHARVAPSVEQPRGLQRGDHRGRWCRRGRGPQGCEQQSDGEQTLPPRSSGAASRRLERPRARSRVSQQARVLRASLGRSGRPVDVAPWLTDEPWIAEVGLECNVATAQRAGAAHARQRDDVTIVGFERLARQAAFLAVHVRGRDLGGAPRAIERSDGASRLTDALQFVQQAAAVHQRASALEEPVDQCLEVVLGGLGKHGAQRVGVHDDAHLSVTGP
jgi:hypothetical protein